MSALKEKVLELAAIAKECPENLQAICFELLLKNHLDSVSPKQKVTRSDEIGKPAPGTEKPAPDSKTDQDRKPLTPEESAEGQDDLAESDLHIKVRHFMKKYGATIEHLNNLYYKDKGKIESLYEDLKTTRMGEGQIRIALLQALRGAIENGEFQTAVEAEPRQTCASAMTKPTLRPITGTTRRYSTSRSTIRRLSR